MIFVDLAFLVVVSLLLGMRSLYLGAVVLIFGFLIGFQAIRTRRLLGSEGVHTRMAHKVKALVLATVLGLSALPFVLEDQVMPTELEKLWSQESALPIVVMICLFAAAAISALAVEKRKR
jgi:hypothetical protein